MASQALSQVPTQSRSVSSVDVPNAPKGVERRRHRVYVTRNTEYHFRDGTCVAVRDRKTEEFLPGHLALNRRIEGGLKFFMNGALIPNLGEPKEGESLFFGGSGRDLVTSPLLEVARPPKDLVLAYPRASERVSERDVNESFWSAFAGDQDEA
jgi:hypothetical protein